MTLKAAVLLVACALFNVLSLQPLCSVYARPFCPSILLPRESSCVGPEHRHSGRIPIHALRRHDISVELRGGCDDLPATHLPVEFTDVIIVPGPAPIAIPPRTPIIPPPHPPHQQPPLPSSPPCHLHIPRRADDGEDVPEAAALTPDDGCLYVRRGRYGWPDQVALAAAARARNPHANGTRAALHSEHGRHFIRPESPGRNSRPGSPGFRSPSPLHDRARAHPRHGGADPAKPSPPALGRRPAREPDREPARETSRGPRPGPGVACR
jgi:hypothetical protein